MLKVIKKHARATNCVFMSIDVALMSFLLFLGIFHIVFYCFLLLTLNRYRLGIRLFRYKLALSYSYSSQGTTIYVFSRKLYI